MTAAGSKEADLGQCGRTALAIYVFTYIAACCRLPILLVDKAMNAHVPIFFSVFTVYRIILLPVPPPTPLHASLDVATRRRKTLGTRTREKESFDGGKCLVESRGG